MPSLRAVAHGGGKQNGGWFGFFQGETDGYLYKTVPTKDLQETVDTLLAENPDAGIRNISSGEGLWLVYAETRPHNPRDRKFIVTDDYDDFMLLVTGQLEESISLRAVYYHDGHWAAYFEGRVQGKAIISTCSENSELLPTIDQKIEESDASLKCLCYGDDIWFLYFEGELGDDALWEMNPGFVDFTKKVEKNGEDDASLKIVANGNGVWFGYWEGAVPGDQGWSWQHKPLLAEFLKEIETQWDDDAAESPQKAKPAADAAEGGAAKEAPPKMDAPVEAAKEAPPKMDAPVEAASTATADNEFSQENLALDTATTAAPSKEDALVDRLAKLELKKKEKEAKKAEKARLKAEKAAAKAAAKAAK